MQICCLSRELYNIGIAPLSGDMLIIGDLGLQFLHVLCNSCTLCISEFVFPGLR